MDHNHESITEISTANLTVGRLIQYLQQFDPMLNLSVMEHHIIHISVDTVLNKCDLSYESECDEDEGTDV